MGYKNEDKANLLLRRAINGDTKALDRLKRVSPKVFELALDGYADLGEQVQTALIEAIYLRRWGKVVEGDRLAVASVQRQADEIRVILFDVHKSPLERLLADRVVCCWLAICAADKEVANWPPDRHRDDRQKWVDRCYRRFSMAAKDLATVHKLLGPSVQVNIANEQKIANIAVSKGE